jgi:hypothetical protein
MRQPVVVTPEQMPQLVEWVSDFGLDMLKTAFRYRDEMSSEARGAFDSNVKNFTAKVGEFYPIEDLIAAAMSEGSDDEA